MGITLDGSVTGDRAAKRSAARGAGPALWKERGPRWADIASDAEEAETEEEVFGAAAGHSDSGSGPQAKDAPEGKCASTWATATKRPQAVARGNRRSERVVAAAPQPQWAAAAQPRWKVKDAAAGKTSAASSPTTQRSWDDEWSSSWDEEWSSSWDEEWATHSEGSYAYDGAYDYDKWSWPAYREGGRKLQCQFLIGIEEEPQFRVCRRLLGPAGKHMKAIAEKTQARLRLRGKGSRFREGPSWQESDDPLMLCVSALGRDSYDQAVTQVRELLEGIYRDYAALPEKDGKPAPLLKVSIHEGAREGR